MALHFGINVFVVQIVICLPYSYYCYTDAWTLGPTRKEWKDGDRGIIRLLVPQTLTLFLPHTHTHTHMHAWLTYVWKLSHVCMRGRNHVKWASVHVKHAASGNGRTMQREREREREREKTEDTLLLLSATISLFLPYTQTGQEANYSAYCLCSTTRQQQIQTWSSQRPHTQAQAHHPLRVLLTTAENKTSGGDTELMLISDQNSQIAHQQRFWLAPKDTCHIKFIHYC